jgi:hypothetical protein
LLASNPSPPISRPVFRLPDAQNSRLLVDGAGALGHRWEWEPFGKTRADQGTTAAAFGYGGEQKDDDGDRATESRLTASSTMDLTARCQRRRSVRRGSLRR